jgi:hypothetical protein
VWVTEKGEENKLESSASLGSSLIIRLRINFSVFFWLPREFGQNSQLQAGDVSGQCWICRWFLVVTENIINILEILSFKQGTCLAVQDMSLVFGRD